MSPIIGPIASTADQSFDLIVIPGPAPANLALLGITGTEPYTGPQSMVELTNRLHTSGCTNGSACNTVTRRIFTGGSVTIQKTGRIFLPALRK